MTKKKAPAKKPTPKAKTKPTGKPKAPAKVLHMATHKAKAVQAKQAASTPGKKKSAKAPKDAALPQNTYQGYELLEDLPTLVKAQQDIKRKMAAAIQPAMDKFSVTIDGEKLNWAEAEAKEKELRGLMEALLVAEGLEGTDPDQFVMVNGLKVKRTVKKGKKEINRLLLIEAGTPIEVIDDCTVEGDPSTYVTVRDPNKRKGAGEMEDEDVRTA